MEYSVFTYKTKFLTDSHVLGNVTVPYERLAELFKEPLVGDGKNSDVEWNIQLENNHIIGIYNYRNGRAYLGKDAPQAIDITSWTITGFYDTDFESIQEFLEGKTTLSLNVHMYGRDKDNIIKRLRSIADHIEQGMTETEKPSDYHSWSLEKILVPDTEEAEPPKDPTYRL